MPSTRERRSTSAVSYTESEATELRGHLNELKLTLRELPADDSVISSTIQTITERSHFIRQSFLENPNPNHIRDAFRNLGGFQILLDLFRFSPTVSRLESTREDLLGFFNSLLGLLTASLQDHWGNCKYFRTRIERGGWAVISQTIEELLEQYESHAEDLRPIRERLFGYLLGCGIEDESVSELFLKLGRHLDPQETHLSHHRNGDVADTIESVVKADLGSQFSIPNPEIVCMLFDLWSGSIRTPNQVADAVSLFTPAVIRSVARSSTRNLVAIHEVGLLSKILPLLNDPLLRPVHLQEIQSLAVILLDLGVGNINDAYFLYKNAASSQVVAKTLRQGLGSACSPPYIHFDLTLHGFSCVELPDIGRTFPPPATSPGYTLSMWLQIVHFDPNSHTTLFGALDPTQTCFVLVYLEKDSKNLILQTSVTSSRPSVRFKSFVFEASKWYHVCIVHRRPKATSSSRASLFIDGEFVEQAKSHYPSPPPVSQNSTNKDLRSPVRKNNAVQTFLGTPQDLAANLGPELDLTRWRLASACLFNDALSDDLIAVYKELGPRYHGNYQDCLGSFQTYKASAALNLRNETLHPGKEEKSDIVAAIRSKAGDLLPESKFLFNISPVMVFDDNDRNNIDEIEMAKSLSKAAARNLRYQTRGGRKAVAVNGALSSINEALTQTHGLALLTGDPSVVVPQSLDDAAWRIGGCGPIGLSLVEAARSDEDIIRALEILFATVKNSWRNSEAMERENGFGILATLLTTKLSKSEETLNHRANGVEKVASHDLDSLSFNILLLILDFVGFERANPENSVINNPLAYRILLVDLDIWRSSSPEVQQLYYEQLTTFSVGSKHHLFNSKRLGRMRITKKWLEALKGDTFFHDTIGYFLHAFESLLSSALPSETHRSLALYITYAVHKPKEKTSLRATKTVRRPNIAAEIPVHHSKPNAPLRENSDHNAHRVLSRSEVGRRILELYTKILCQQDTSNIKRFARTVTNKWLLNLLVDEDSTVVVLSTKILARVLIVNGSSYVEKFSEKTGGFVIMQHRLRRWWKVTPLWSMCFAILFGKDVANYDLQKPFDLYGLLEDFPPQKTRAIYPGVLPVITAMLQNAIKSVIRDQPNPDSPQARISGEFSRSSEENTKRTVSGSRTHAVSLQGEVGFSTAQGPQPEDRAESGRIVQTITRFLADLHSNSQGFRDFATTTCYVQELLFLLFPIIVSSDAVNPETELHSRDSSLTFNGSDVIIRPLSETSQKAAPIVRTTSVEESATLAPSKTQPLRRGSSYVLITSEASRYQPSSAKLEPIGSPKGIAHVPMNTSHRLIQEVLEIIIAVFTDQVMSRKDFAGIGLFMKVPPGFQEHQAYFESFVLRNTISSLSNTIKLNQKLLWEPKVLTNLQRFCAHLDEAVYEGWFIDGADIVLEFLGEILEYLQRPDVWQMKSIRLCSEVIAAMRSTISRIALLRLSESDDSPGEKKTALFLNKLSYWQTVLFASETSQEDFLRLLCYLLYTKLVSVHEAVRQVAANLWRTLLVQKPDETSGVLYRIMNTENKQLSRGFEKILELDNDSFLAWAEDHRQELDAIFFGKLTGSWDSFVAKENRTVEESYKGRIAKRRDKLKAWVTEGLVRDDIIRRHEISSDHWKANIYASEHLKRQRTIQDQQDGSAFNISSWASMMKQLKQPCGLLDDHEPQKWQLDLTEGRNRMRLRVIPDREAHSHNYQAKGTSVKGPKKTHLTVTTQTKSLSQTDLPIAPSPINEGFRPSPQKNPTSSPENGAAKTKLEADDDFEMVDEPEPESENFEDKNRKVMRSLQRGDQVEHVHNISRIVGLEACEGLLIIGKSAFYLLDDFFQRSDGEIVDVWQAPVDERDSYMQMISGHQAGAQTPRPLESNHESRSWRWEDVLSISKRRFLFRDVAIEIFFMDGQSYLLTIATPKLRDELYQKLLNKAQSGVGGMSSTNTENLWRVESLRTAEDNPQTLGSRFTSVFAQGIANPATKRWIKGEISNFQYLMVVNTMAGRTFNDLTQYPVFPWVLADYTSEELDLANPRTFRDLTKPMGCQTFERQAEFKERYQSFAEMGDHNAPPFHYGTHYSSAMIVTSYMIRLQPFVQSHLLVQGGTFDHPDRLFYSIEKTWTSASRDNMTDVRELIPEFYCLPEMFVNANSYDFGVRQGDAGSIDNVALPPWAKGDPKIFVAKHREALESDHVSQHLHQWIDLIFGHKQRGEAALEATNVFHHLSYRGARNLDEIDDPHERLATIGIIHNFGQTPHQVFHRAHPAREDSKQRPKKLDTLADTLTRLPFPLLENPDRISKILYSYKNDRLICAGPLRLNIPPNYDKHMEWGFVDGSVRFYVTETKRLVGLFEHIHQGQLSAATFVDSRTLITAGTDCTISVWTVTTTTKMVDLVPKGSLFGHRAPVNAMAVTRSFSTLLSSSTDGAILLWDLNRLELVRVVAEGKPIDCAVINDTTGTMLLCAGPKAALYTLNGDLLLEQHVCAEGDEAITSCAFYEGSGNEYLEQNLVFTGHRRGAVNIWNIAIHDGKFVLDHIRRLNHLDSGGYNIGSAITCVLPMSQAVYIGDDDGRVYEWDCIQRQ